jgi:uncharacterized membrane protein
LTLACGCFFFLRFFLSSAAVDARSLSESAAVGAAVLGPATALPLVAVGAMILSLFFVLSDADAPFLDDLEVSAVALPLISLT